MILLTVLVYFALLFAVSRFAGSGNNEAFFNAGRKSPWWAVAFGMIGASLSGATFISVPGMVLDNDMTYIQMCIGFFFGYLVVSFVLLPIYYKHNLTSIYEWLRIRFGRHSHKTGALVFILSKFTGAAIRMYIVCLILHQQVFAEFGISYELAVCVILLFIWFYTYKCGVKALVWTDSLQTLVLFVALFYVLFRAVWMLDIGFAEAVASVMNDSRFRIFETEDIFSKQHFVKHFVSGVLIVIAMTGLDQGLMQKNLTCKNLRSAQKDMCSYGIMFIPVNFLFLTLGILMVMLYNKAGLQTPVCGDSLMTDYIADGYMGHVAVILFTIGIMAPALASVDSSVTALTTCVCVDLIGTDKTRKNLPKLRIGERVSNEVIRKIVHAVVLAVFALLTIMFKSISGSGVVDMIYTVASYTYGPLLGLFAFGLVSSRHAADKAVPFICLLSPFVCYAIDLFTTEHWGYEFGYEMLLLNGGVTFLALQLTSLMPGRRPVAKR